MRGAGEAVYEYIRELHGRMRHGFVYMLLVGWDVVSRVRVKSIAGGWVLISARLYLVRQMAGVICECRWYHGVFPVLFD